MVLSLEGTVLLIVVEGENELIGNHELFKDRVPENMDRFGDLSEI